jgi:tetratricopeptide (TPR) repeat protein
MSDRFPYTRLLTIAERHPRRGLRLVQNLCSNGQDELHGFMQGWALLAAEQVEPARHRLTIAHEVFAAAGNEQLALRSALGLLMVRQLTGEGETLRRAWEALADELAQARLSSELAQLRGEQIVHLNLLGHSHSALQLAVDNAELVAGHGSAAVQARFWQGQGVAALSTGDLAQAFVLLDKALCQYKQLQHQVGKLRVLFDRAWAWVRKEAYAEAEHDLLVSKAFAERLGLPLRIALCEKDLGSIANRLGAYSEALRYGLHARETFLTLGRRDLVVRCELNLGAVAYNAGLLDTADAAYRRAGAAFISLGNERLALTCQRNRAIVALEQGQPDLVLEILAEVAVARERHPDPLEQAESELLQGQALYADGKVQEALVVIAQAVARFAEKGNADGVARSVHERAWAELEMGQFGTAADGFHQVQQALAHRPAHAWRVAYGLGLLAEQRGDVRAALDQYMQSAAIVASLRGQLASEHASSAMFVRCRPMLERAIGLALNTERYDLALQLIEQQRGLSLLRLMFSAYQPALPLRARLEERRQELLAQIAAGAPSSVLDTAMNGFVDALLQARHSQRATPSLPAQYDLARLREHLIERYGNGWSLLMPYQLGSVVLLFLVTPEDVVLERQPYDSELQTLLGEACLPRYRLQTYRDLQRLRNSSLPAWATLQALAMRLLPVGLRERLDPAHRLFIVPSGPLYALPWAALRLDSGWLCQQAIIEILPSLTMVNAPEERSGSEGEQAALLIGCGAFGGRAPDLAAALPSLDLVAQHWSGPCKRLEEAQASKERVLEWAAQGELHHYRLIHIASHAHLGLQTDLLGHIKLADNDLYLDEVLGLGLHNALVVLAACDGGAGRALPGDEALGITRALLAAGATNVVASLWQVYDGAILALLEPLYRGLHQGVDAPTALAQAQRQMIEQRGERAIFAEPLVWGGMQVHSINRQD